MTSAAPKCNRTASDRQVLLEGASSGTVYHFILPNNHFSLFDRGDIDQTAFVDRGAFAVFFGLLHGDEDVSGLCDSFLRRGENLIGQCNLLGMDRPLSNHAEGGGTARLGAVPSVIAEIAKGSINWQHPMGATGRNDRRLCPVPRILPILNLAMLHIIIFLRAADASGLHAHAGGEICRTQGHRHKPR